MRHGQFSAAVSFLFIGLLFTIVATIFGVLNAFSNPIEFITGIDGLIIWHDVAGMAQNVSFYHITLRNILKRSKNISVSCSFTRNYKQAQHFFFFYFLF